MNGKKKITASILCLFFAVFLSLTSFAQIKPKLKLKKTIRGEFQIPVGISNKAFTSTFSGVINTGLSFNLEGIHLAAGGFYSFSQFQIFPKFIDDPHTILSIQTCGIKLYYNNLTSTGNGMWSPYIAPGYSWLDYSRIQSKHHAPGVTKLSTMSLNVGAAYNIMLDEWTGVGFTIGYNMVNHVFHPYDVCLDEWYSYTEGQKKGILQNLVAGFSVYFDLAKKPDTAE